MQTIEKTAIRGAAAEYASLNRGNARPAADKPDTGKQAATEPQDAQDVLYTRRGALLQGVADAAAPTEGFDRYF
jgi:hypothetical protein